MECFTTVVAILCVEKFENLVKFITTDKKKTVLPDTEKKNTFTFWHISVETS